MYPRYRRRGTLGGLSGGVFMIGLALAIFVGPFLPIFFVTLAVTALLGSISSYNPHGLYGGLFGFMWMLMLALFFITGSPIWFLIGAGLSAILGALRAPIMAAILGMGIMGASTMANRQPPQQAYYQPPEQPQQPYYQPPEQTEQPYEAYNQGYQAPTQPQVTSQDDEQQHYQYSPLQGQRQTAAQPQYETPQAQYPQELPPQEQ